MFYTDRQLAILEFIQRYRGDRGVSPTLEEIAQHFGVTKVTIYDHIRQLEKKGAIRKVPHLARSLEILDEEFLGASAPAEVEPTLPVSLRGSIAAGTGIEAIENPETIDLAEMLPPGSESYALQVRGNSMIDDGIHDGDLVLVERRQDASNGEVVVAIIGDNEATLKRFYREPEGAPARYRLQPANEALEPIYVDDLEIRGVVIGVIRQFS